MGRFSEALVEQDKKPSRFSDALSGFPQSEIKTPTGEPTVDNLSDFLMSAVNPLYMAKPGEAKSFARGVENVGEGFTQLGMDAMEYLGFLEPGTTNAYTKKTLSERRAFAKMIEDEYGDKFSFKLNEAAGEIIPYFLFPQAASASAPVRIAAGTGTGAAVGASTFQEGATQQERTAGRGEEGTVGALFGGILSSLLEVAPMVKNLFKKHISPDLRPSAITELSKEAQAAGVKELEDVARKVSQQKFVSGQAEKALKISDLTGVKFKLSQIVDDPALEAMEQFARNSQKGERAARAFERNQPSQVFKYFKRVQQKLDPKGAPFPERVNAAFNDVMGDATKGTGLLGARAKNAKVNFAKASTEDSAIPLKALKVELEGMISHLETVPRFRGQEPLLAELKHMQKQLSDWTLNPVQIQNLLQGWGRAAKGTERLFKDLDSAQTRGPAKQLFMALNRDLDDAAAQPGAKLLKKARDQYREDSALIDIVEDSAIGALFGKAGKVAPEDIGTAFIKMRPSEIKSTMDILAKSDPGLQRSLQRHWLQHHLTKAQVSGQSGYMEFVPGKMLDLKQRETRDIYKAVFNDAESRKMVRDGIEAVRFIMKNNQSTGGRSLPKVKELAGVLASRDKTFMARLASELFAPELVAKYVIKPEGVKALQVLSKPFNQNAATAALVTLSDILRREEITEER